MLRSACTIAVLAVACRHPASSTTTSSSASAPATSATPCASIVTSYDALVSSAGTCTKDADCECFQGGVSPLYACGGVADHATAAKLEKLRADYEVGSCNALSCAAWMCKPACNAGHCTSD